MPTNLFISFSRRNLSQVANIKSIAKDPEHELEFHDRSEQGPVKDKKGTPFPYPPNDKRAEPVIKELSKLLDKATKLLVLIGKDTSERQWVNWEIQTFIDKKSNLKGDPKKRIIAMHVKGCNDVTLPRRVRRLGITRMSWDLEALACWIDANPNYDIKKLSLPLMD